MTESLLAPRDEHFLLQARHILLKNKMKPIKHYDKGAKDLETLPEGDTARVQPFGLGQKTWDKAVANKRVSDRSYEIETANGSFIRNRVHLKKTKEAPPIKVQRSETESKVQRSETENKVQRSETENKVQRSETENKVQRSETENKVQRSESNEVESVKEDYGKTTIMKLKESPQRI